MPSIFKEHQLIILARSFSSRTRFLFSTIIFLVFFLFWFFSFYSPILKEIDLISFKIKSLENQIFVYDNALAKSRIANGLGTNLGFELNREVKNSLKSEDSLRFFLDLMSKCGLTYKNVKPINAKLDDLIEKKYFMIKSTGDFNSFIKFFNSLEESKLVVKFKDIEFKQSKKNKLIVFSVVRFVTFLSEI